ncbi:hypothetical protein SARC_09094 [Sphaeroforma arctica JP610]|uniref:FAD dependent oxidoreductase domain-containing protein n=1 Tax=Sphaeroforma arctica JP610 TaxID=667725 RepID=A0A0L0FNS0_9EUKA|nr:hypothetical protein SARC_09094 [Sphaeroforma arctica JP610]KNC78480.1 hypothetical protein SARC_09094 [Sphaeroforma arctica JP610]|eukprot:XP_014152382.1 hypothetical protein SARC_09094 [Sphaeroforma arctica JP610]
MCKPERETMTEQSNRSSAINTSSELADITRELAGNQKLSVAVVGGGVAGSTISLRLSEMGVNVTLIEKGPGLVNGPPMCHLHAGGNLYREISDQQCLKLLKQSIETVRIYPTCINVRPTVITVPTQDNGEPLDLLPRLRLLKARYHELVAENPRNKVLGEPNNYYRLYERAELEQLALRPTPTAPNCNDDWMVPIAKEVDLNRLKFPLVLVQEYGLSSLRIAATAELTLGALDNCDLRTHTELLSMKEKSVPTTTDCTTLVRTNSESESDSDTDNEGESGWELSVRNVQTGQTEVLNVDYVVNASGYRTGAMDDMSGFKRERFVEFKAAYVTKWNGNGAVWPEVIFHGVRGTPKGMAQITPYPDGHYQLHGMTKNITLFDGGLVASTDESAQPQLPASLESKITTGWEREELIERADSSIGHLAGFIPSFTNATWGGKPLYGAQQIPGKDASMRAASVSFEKKRYARAEIVKASSALTAANEIVEELRQLRLLDSKCSELDCVKTLEERFAKCLGFNGLTIEDKAVELAINRNYPAAIARPYSYPSVAKKIGAKVVASSSCTTAQLAVNLAAVRMGEAC